MPEYNSRVLTYVCMYGAIRAHRLLLLAGWAGFSFLLSVFGILVVLPIIYFILFSISIYIYIPIYGIHFSGLVSKSD